MRLLFISKRHPQQRDLVERPYGRFYYLPTQLARMGHDVQVSLCSHQGLQSSAFQRDGVKWTSHDFRTLGPVRAVGKLRSEAEGFCPDWVVGCSDTWPALIAQHLARRTGARLAVDAYDNYEAYMPFNFPLHSLWRRAIAAADVAMAAGPQLAVRLDEYRSERRATAIVPMAADPAFIPHDQLAARAALNLPLDAPLVGYLGGWARNRGTAILIEAFRLLLTRIPDARLVLTGRPPRQALAEPGVLPLGYIDDAQLPIAISALSVACVVTANSSFGRYSYPAKLCEAMACNAPLVATATQPVRWMLRDDERFLSPVGDAPALADRIVDLLGGPRRFNYSGLPSWEESARVVESEFADLPPGRSV